MEQQLTLHIVGGTSRSRAELARFAFARGHHAEVYADLAELLHRPIAQGVVIASGEILEAGIARLIEGLGAVGTWLPVIAASEEPRVEDIVDAVRQGALDFCPLPIDHAEFDRLLARVDADGAAQVAARRGAIEAQHRIAGLSRREREVLDWLCEGSSNKVIARALDISPRTVEIHRANMMEKLGVQHSAEAVRLQCVAGLGSTARGEEVEAAPVAPFRPAASAARAAAIPLYAGLPSARAA